MNLSEKYLFNPRPALLVITCAVVVLGIATGKCLQPDGENSGRLSFFGNAPLYFEASDSQSEDAARFIARGQDCDVALSPNQAVIVLTGRDNAAFTAIPRNKRAEAQTGQTRTVRLTLQGANPAGRMAGLEELPGRANYLIGNDPAAWRTGVPLFARVKADEVYPGVEVIYYADQSAHLEYDFVLQPKARPERILFHIEGADMVRVDAAGDLVLKIGTDEIRQHEPVIYQEVRGRRRQVQGGYRLSGKTVVGFWLGAYDHDLPLIIDPTLSFSTYLGGKKTDIGWSIALDGNENVYVAGETLSKGLPGTNGVFQPKYAGGIRFFGDAFVAKYGSVSNELVYLTYLGGRTDDGALGLAVDPDGYAYVTGFTDSKDFPIVPTIGVIRSQNNGVRNNAFRLPPVDAFVAKLDTNGSALLFSTLLGGTKRDSGVSIAVSGEDVYVAGMTESTNFVPVPNGFQTNSGGNADVFVVKLVGGTNAIYSTYLGGTNMDYPESIAVDSAGSAYLTGFTSSTNFPLKNPLEINGVTYTNLNTRTNFSTFTDAFVSKLSPDGASLVYSSYLGGSNDDSGLHIALDSSGNAYVTGYTTSTNFPSTIETQPKSSATNFLSHVFVTKIGPDGGTNVVFSTQFGGNRSDQGTGIAVDTNDFIYVTGFTSSTNFFATNTFLDYGPTNAITKKAARTPNNVFVTVLSPDGAYFTNSVYIGGLKNDQANDIAITPSGSAAYIVGQTFSKDFPVTNSVQSNLVQTNLGGVKHNNSSDAFVGKIEFP